MEDKFVTCPNCDTYVEVLELNCQIFRCGILRSNLQQINPHLHKEECDRLANNNLIYGCGKPFRVDIVNNKFVSTICDYI